MNIQEFNELTDIERTIAYLWTAEQALHNIGDLGMSEDLDEIEDMERRITTLRNNTRQRLEELQDKNHDGQWAILGTGFGEIPASIVYQSKSREDCFQWMKESYPQYIGSGENPDKKQFPLNQQGRHGELAARLVYLNPDGTRSSYA